MSRIFRQAHLLALLLAVVPAAWAQDSQTLDEVRQLRALVEKQSRQIDALTEQLAKLRLSLEVKGEAAPLAPASAAPAPATPAPTPPSSPAVEFSAEAPKAEPPDGRRHVVIKGETLTSIAKHYNIPLPELKKSNKDVDERKLQIGQTLTIPTPKGAEAPAKKEDNP